MLFTRFLTLKVRNEFRAGYRPLDLNPVAKQLYQRGYHTVHPLRLPKHGL